MTAIHVSLALGSWCLAVAALDVALMIVNLHKGWRFLYGILACSMLILASLSFWHAL